MSGRRPIPVALPLAVWERDGLYAALGKAGLSTADIKSDGPLFWRFENDGLPVGFGGLQVHGDQALLRSVVTLPPVRGRGIGAAIVAALETEARVRNCRAVWLAAGKAADFFARIGYRACKAADAPEVIRESADFVRAGAASAMMKPLG